MSLEQINPSGQFVCPNCGWSVIDIDVKYNHHNARCHAAAGRLASDLAAALPELRSTKFGYGDGRLAFDIGGDRTVVFDCHPDRLWLHHVGRAHALDAEAARDLVATLNEWSKRHPTVRTKTAQASGG